MSDSTATLRSPVASPFLLQNVHLSEWHLYGSASQGRVAISRPDTILRRDSAWAITRSDTTIGARRVRYRDYELKDHLGNVRVTITDMKMSDPGGSPGASPFTADMRSYQHSYPFGMPQPGRVWNGDSARYGYNGKEKDNEVNGNGNEYDYGFRVYNPRLGRFLSVDPLAPEYPELTPYQFASNMPIWAVDEDGAEARVYGPQRPPDPWLGSREAVGTRSSMQSNRQSRPVGRNARRETYGQLYPFGNTPAMPEGGPPVETISSDGVSQMQKRRAMWSFVRAATQRTSAIGGTIYDIADEIHVHITANQSRLGTTGTRLDGTTEGAEGTLQARIGLLEDLYGTFLVLRIAKLGSQPVRSVQMRTRTTLGMSDEATSQHIIETENGVTTSVTHRVVRADGETVHQHQTHIGKYNTRRRFPDEWNDYPIIGTNE